MLFQNYFPWCTNVWQQESKFFTFRMGGEFIPAYMTIFIYILYVKPQSNNDPALAKR